MIKLVEKLLAAPKPEKIKGTELIDTPTVLPHAGRNSTCKFLLMRLSFLTSLIIMVVRMHLYNSKKQCMIRNLQGKERKGNSLTRSYIHTYSDSKLGHFTRSYVLYSDLLRSSLRIKHRISAIKVQLCFRDGAFLLDVYGQKWSVPWQFHGLCNKKTTSSICKPETHLESPSISVTTSEELNSIQADEIFLFLSQNTISFSSLFYCTGIFCLLITDLVLMHICGHKTC